MKNFIKLFGIITVAALIGFSMVGCSPGGNNDYDLINGVWEGDGTTITINGSIGRFSAIATGANWKTLFDNGMLKIGDPKFRNIVKGSSLYEWRGEILWINNQRQVTWVSNAQFVLAPDSKVLRVNSTSGNKTYQRK